MSDSEVRSKARRLFESRFKWKNEISLSGSIPSDSASQGRKRWVGRVGIAAIAYPDFGRSVDPISTRGEDFAPHIITCPPSFR